MPQRTANGATKYSTRKVRYATPHRTCEKQTLYLGEGLRESLLGVQSLGREAVPFPHLDEWVDTRSLSSQVPREIS